MNEHFEHPAAPPWPELMMPSAAESVILVVDDVPKNIQVVGSMLREAGYEIMPATSGAQALARAKAQAPDLVLLDLMMPEMDGFEVCRRFQADSKLKRIPIIFLTAANETEKVVEGFGLGAVDYVGKPFQAAELLARVRTHLELKHSRSALLETTNRLRQELAEASVYLRSLIPAPQTERIKTDWRLIPCTELGGDSFGYHWIDDDHFAFYLLDVCGHGVGAALLSATAINVLRAHGLAGVDFREPGPMLSALNDRFLMKNQNNLYFTIWYGVFQPSTRRLRFASAGHPPPIILHGPPSEPSRVEQLPIGSIFLGALPGVTYDTMEAHLPSPCRVYLLSDGTYELRRADGSMLEFRAFLDFIAEPIAEGVDELDRLVSFAREIHGPGALDDDLSIVRLEF